MILPQTLIIFIFFMVLEFGLGTCKTGVLPFQSCLQPFSVLIILEIRVSLFAPDQLRPQSSYFVAGLAGVHHHDKLCFVEVRSLYPRLV
jgi:hypothetical protein